MSIVDFSATPHHHAEILINIEIIGNIQGRELDAVLAKIRKHTRLAIADAGRVVYFRFQVGVSPDNCRWGTFQPHRKAMGLVIVAGCPTAMDVALMHQKFQKTKDSFAEFIFDSRCFIFGIDNVMLQQSKAEVSQFTNAEAWTSSDRDMKEFLTSVFYVLESKRVLLANDKSDRPPLITAIFENNQSSNTDSDSRNHKKKHFGRWRKHLADVSLLAGLPLEALQNHRIAIDALSFINDQIWLGGALEGLAIASAIILYPEASDFPAAEPEEESPQATKQTLDPRNLMSSNVTGAPSFAHLQKNCIQSEDELVEKYKDAVICYTRCRDMAIVEVEACIKATKVLAVLNKPLKAAEFIQNAIYIGLDITHAERIIKYDCMANLYNKINFHRKSSFYKRIAAMQCVAPNLEQPDWFGCNLLLQGTLLGSKLDLTSDMGIPGEKEATPNRGWPQIQLRIMHELIFASRKIGDNQMANRYTVYLLMKMHRHLTDAEIKEYCVNLEASSSRISQNKEAELLQLQDGTILPSLSLYSLPIVRDVAPQPLQLPLRPALLRTGETASSVFLFSPFAQQGANDDSDTINFQWCVNTLAETTLKVTNPLSSHHVRISRLKLICEIKLPDKSPQKDFDCHSVALDIPPAGCADVTLALVPLKPGRIHVKGYEFVLFGVRSRCLFSNIPWIKVDEFEIEVIPELPLLQRNSSFLSSEAQRISVGMYPGESQDLDVSLMRDSCENRLPIDFVELKSSVSTPTSSLPPGSRKIIDSESWLRLSCEHLHLPLLPGKQKSLKVKLVAGSENLADDKPIARKTSKVCDGQIKIRYSGGKAVDANWCREIAIDIRAKLHPGLFVEKLYVEPAERQESCKVTMVVINFSKHVFDLSWNEGAQETVERKNCSVEPDEQHTLVAMMPTIDFKISNESQEKSRSWNPPTSSSQTSDLQTRLSKLLDVKWEIKGNGRHGSLDTSKLPLSRDCVVNLIRPPVNWRFFLNDVDVTQIKRYDATIGEPCYVTVTIRNTTDFCIPLVDVDLEIFQDQMNGFREWNMEDCALCLGAQSQRFEQIKAGASVDFEATVIFLLRGRFLLRLHRAASSSILESSAQLKLRRTSSSSSTEKENFHNFSPIVMVSAGVSEPER